MATALFPGQAMMPTTPQYGSGVPSILRRPTTPQPGAGGIPALLAAHQANPMPQAPTVASAAPAAPSAPAAVSAPPAAGAPGFDPILDAIRNLTSGAAASRAAGARMTAQNSSYNDPSLAAYGSLMGELGGQDQASEARNNASLDWMKTLHDQAWQEQMDRLKAKLDRETMAAGQGDPLSQLLGIAAGSILGPLGKKIVG